MLTTKTTAKAAGSDTAYEVELGRVKDTLLGLEDHGIFAWNINFEFPGSGQGTGCRTFNKDAVDLFPRLLAVIGVSKWEDLPGKAVYVLRAENDTYGQIVGLANVDRPSQHLIF